MIRNYKGILNGRQARNFYLCQCDGKVAYNKTDAQMIARKMSAEYFKKFNAYYCIFCHNWHVGKDNKFFNRKLRKRKNIRHNYDICRC